MTSFLDIRTIVVSVALADAAMLAGLSVQVAALLEFDGRGQHRLRAPAS